MNIEAQVKGTIKRYKLFTKRDKIAVAASGGKDSTVLLYILTKLGYNIYAITVDSEVGQYSKENIKNLRGFCKQHAIPLMEFSFSKEFGQTLKQIHKEVAKGTSYCTTCGVLRRHLINKYAKLHKFDKLATGHNSDDEAQATLMNIFRNDYLRFKRLGPSVGSVVSDQFVQRVKPLYFVPEKAIIKFSKTMGFPVVYARCPHASEAYREDVKDFLKPFDEKVVQNILEFTLKHMDTQSSKFKLKECKQCGEPTNGELCKACQIINLVGDNNESVS